MSSLALMQENIIKNTSNVLLGRFPLRATLPHSDTPFLSPVNAQREPQLNDNCTISSWNSQFCSNDRQLSLSMESLWDRMKTMLGAAAFSHVQIVQSV
jgi:hypothetical protein